MEGNLNKILKQIILDYVMPQYGPCTAGVVTDVLRQHGEALNEGFEFKTKHRQYQLVYSVLMSLRRKGLVTSCLGGPCTPGREVRHFELKEAN